MADKDTGDDNLVPVDKEPPMYEPPPGNYCHHQCEALVDQPAWWRNGDGQCGRGARPPRTELANAILCWQHQRKAAHDGELPLTGGRLLSVQTRWSDRLQRWEIVGAQIVTNVIDLQRLKRDIPPPGWEPVTMEDQRRALEALANALTPSSADSAND